MRPKSRITCLTMDYPPMRGGVARYLSKLAEASDGQMSVVVPIDHPQLTTIEEVEHVKFWSESWPKWSPLVKRCLEIGKDRVIFVSHVFPVGTAAWIASFFKRIRYAVLFHGTDLKRVNSRWKKFLLRRICARAEATFANSEATAVALKKLAPKTRPAIMTPGVDEFPNLNRSDTRNRLGVSAEAEVVLCVARLIERKGQDVLLQAVSKLQQQRDELVLVLIGSGDYGPRLHALSELLGVKVRWEEQADDNRVRQWYAAADVFCLPAREQADDVEGFGIVFLEAAAASLPVIAGKGWGTGEAVVDGVTGLLVDPSPDAVADALQKLFNNGALRSKLGQAGIERALRDFKWHDRWLMLARTLNLQLEIFNSNSKVAVVIPCYNHARKLAATLEALSEQTLMPQEVVVVDNGSDDEPEKVVETYKDKLPVTLVRFEDRRGAPAARNEGFRRTVEPFVMFLDADTQLKSNALQAMRAVLEKNPKASFAYSDFYWGRVLFRGRDWDAEALKRTNWIHTCSLVRRSALTQITDGNVAGPFDETLKKFQDWDLWLTLAEHGSSGVWIPESLFKVKERKTGMSSWLPSFVHKLPWPILGWMPREIVRYREAERIIREKHRMTKKNMSDIRL